MADQRKILITGASSGFGLGAARALAERGHRVWATMRGVDGKNAAVAGELRAWARDGRHALEVVELDVTRDDSVERGVKAVLAGAGTLEVLVNNAGVGTWGLQEAFTPEQVKALFDVNVVGMLRVNRAVLPSMRAAGAGYVIYVSSGLGRIQLPFLGPYTASKHAVEAIAETGSYELSPLGIETTILQPGAYGTAFLGHSILPGDPARLEGQPRVKEMFQAFGGAFEARARAGQLGDPKEVVAALVELVEAPRGERPLRRTVGGDVSPAVVPINEVCAQVQNQLLARFGLR
jgi:NAD(P)-dependent dehydrogenase (short-subunit alcohol dehydrogenase family)